MAYQFTQTGAEIQDILDLAQLQIAAPYDSGTSYTAGMYCTKDDGFYVANASTSGTWNASKWDAVTVGDVLETANANISSLNATLTQFNSYTAPTAYSSRATGITGGYVQIGKLVFVAVQCTMATSISSAGVVLTGLPAANATTILSGGLPSSNGTVFAFVNTSGQLGVGAVSSGVTVTFSGVYVTA